MLSALRRYRNDTMKNYWDDLAAWNDAEVRNKHEIRSLCFGLAATFYFRDGHTERKRRAALACFDDYDARFGSSLRWCQASAETSRLGRVDKLRSRDMSPYLLSPKWDTPEAHDRAWAYYWHGGEHKHDASPFEVNGFGSPKMFAEVRQSLSFFRFSVPVLHVREQPDVFVDLVMQCSERLEPVHGYGGVTVLTSSDRGTVQRAAPRIAGFAARYPGLEVDRPMSHKRVTQSGIKGGNWITILSTPFIDRLGGLPALGAALPESFVTHEYGDGVVIVAGPAPEVGDRHRNIDTPAYRELARVLKPIRITEHPAIYPKGRFSEQEGFAEWLARFDD